MFPLHQTDPPFKNTRRSRKRARLLDKKNKLIAGAAAKAALASSSENIQRKLAEEDKVLELIDDSSHKIPTVLPTAPLAQQFKVDIFSDQVDNSKQTAGTSEVKPATSTLVGRGKAIPTKTGRGKHWDQFKSSAINTKMKSLYKIMPNIPGKFEQGGNVEEKNEPVGKKNMWQPVNTIETIGGPENSRQQEKQPMIRCDIDRPNLKVVEGTAASIQLNLDKSKAVMAEKAKVSAKPQVQKKAPKPTPPAAKVQLPSPGLKPTPSVQQNKPQTTGVQGRMTASSFMNVQQQQQPMNNPVHTQSKGYAPHMHGFGYPRGLAGIPKSFLNIQHQQQIQVQQMVPTTQMYPNQQTDQNQYSQGPVWEATIPSTPSWTPVQTGPGYNQGDQMYSTSGQVFDQSGQVFGQGGQAFEQSGQAGSSGQIFVQTDNSMEQPKQQYSPSDVYADNSMVEGNEEGESESTGTKRLSAFQRLGPVTQPKKPKLTINLLFNKEQAVREVVDQSEYAEDKYTPAHLKPELVTSVDDTVMKYLVFWPWKKPVNVRRTVVARQSKSVMLMELEQMEELYERDSAFFEVVVKGYPASWTKEDVLDAVLESVKGKSLIPCFIEFTKDECKFLVIRSRPALVAIHKYGFTIRKSEVELNIAIKAISLSVNQIEFIPRLILRKRLSLAMENETELCLKQFTTTSDVSHFIYFPLNRVSNQTELMHLQSSVPWEFLTRLDLSHNRITSLSGFDLPHYTPRLKHLDLSHNYIEAVTSLLQCRELPLNTITLEGNPLCTDYIDQERYIKVLRMMFPSLKEIDGIKLTLPGDTPSPLRNYCPSDAAHVVEKVLEVIFPLLDAPPEERQLCEELYDVNAVMTVTFMYKLRYGPIYKDYRALFSRARIMDESEMDSIEGAPAIAKVINRWPILQHDPLTFAVDVMYHTETTTIVKISGIVRVTAESLAEDEHLLFFTRTLILHSIDTVEYKITNEMIYWDLPDTDRAREAFQMTTVRSKNLSLKLDGPPDEDLKEKLLQIFMKLTEMERKPSQRCLETKDWHLRNALEYFSKLLKLDNLQPLF